MHPYEQYELVIGLEVHVQLSTRSKAFSADENAFGAEPNTQVDPVSLGHPGALPRYNRAQVESAVRLGLALGSQIARRQSFDRKHYFYTDLPKGYQITQDREPVCVGGRLPIRIGERWQEVRIHHIHMEEDAGKSLHDRSESYSLIDLNRAGVPLLEVVSEPDLRSPEEVDAFMSAMRQLVRYLGISDGNMEEGSLRCDCNVSVRKRGSDQLGTRCEIKNLNSMRYARRAIEFESRRQIDLLEQGGQVVQQTLHFDPATGVTSPLRSKEDAHDYRYFSEPDLPPIELSDEFVDELRRASPTLPWEWYRRFRQENDLSDYDSALLSEESEIAAYFRELATQSGQAKAAANLLINKILPHSRQERMPLTEFPLGQTQLCGFLALIEAGTVSHSAAYQQLWPALLESPDRSPLDLAKQLNLLQVSNVDQLEEVVEKIVAQFPDKVKAFRNGKKGLLGFFMGEVMKATQGKADPKMVKRLLEGKL